MLPIPNPHRSLKSCHMPRLTMFGFTRMFPAGALVDTDLILQQLP